MVIHVGFPCSAPATVNFPQGNVRFAPPCDGYQNARMNGAAKKMARRLRWDQPHFAVELLVANSGRRQLPKARAKARLGRACCPAILDPPRSMAGSEDSPPPPFFTRVCSAANSPARLGEGIAELNSDSKKKRSTEVCTSGAPCPKREPAIMQRADEKPSTLRSRPPTRRLDKHRASTA